MSEKRRLILVSLDGLADQDFDEIADMPAFKRLLEHAAWHRHVKTIYPSLTYPAHATLVTGRLPADHGIVNNTLLQPGRRSPDWFWSRSHLKGDTLYDAAARAGLRTAALLWPVTAGANIDFNMPEVLANRPWEHQILVSLRAGTPGYQLEMNRRFGKLRHGIDQPALDHFVHRALMATLEEKQPDLVLVHFTDLDAQRHDYGFHSKMAMDALKRHDRRLGEILDWMEAQPDRDRIGLCVLGDHSSLDVERVVNLNPLFVERGLIQLDAKGRLRDYRALMKSADGAAYLYVKGPELERVKAHVRKIVEDFAREEDAIEAVYLPREIAAFGADPEAFMMLEAAKGYYFNDRLDAAEPITEISDRLVRGEPFYHWNTHGFSPLKSGYDTVWMMMGEGIRPGEIMTPMSLLDEAPTFAKWLNLPLEGALRPPLACLEPRDSEG